MGLVCAGYRFFGFCRRTQVAWQRVSRGKVGARTVDDATEIRTTVRLRLLGIVNTMRWMDRRCSSGDGDRGER